MTLQAWPVEGIGEIVPGDDLAAIIVEHLAEPLDDGDVVVVTSKVVSKADGLATADDREALIDAETDRLVARRGQTRIVRTHSGLTLAAAGIDASNLEVGTVIPLPPDPDQSAHDLLVGLQALTGARLAVIVTDTAGRAWRVGQTDIAIGAAGITPLLSFDGVEDSYGNVLAVTAPAVADEIAGAADLVAGKLGGHPVVVVRGLPADWLSDDAAGASALIRDEAGDMFGLGARDAVLVAAGNGSTRGFPAPADDHDLLTLAREGIDLALADAELAEDVIEVRPLSALACGLRRGWEIGRAAPNPVPRTGPGRDDHRRPGTARQSLGRGASFESFERCRRMGADADGLCLEKLMELVDVPAKPGRSLKLNSAVRAVAYCRARTVARPEQLWPLARQDRGAVAVGIGHERQRKLARVSEQLGEIVRGQ